MIAPKQAPNMQSSKPHFHFYPPHTQTHCVYCRTPREGEKNDSAMHSIEADYRPRQKDLYRARAEHAQAQATLHLCLCPIHAEKVSKLTPQGWDYWSCVDSIDI